jgi:hypothetical protein
MESERQEEELETGKGWGEVTIVRIQQTTP